MAKVTLEDIIVVLLGIPDTDDRGMAGNIKDIKKDITDLVDGQTKQNLAISKNKIRIGIIFGLGTVIGAPLIIAFILKLVGLY